MGLCVLATGLMIAIGTAKADDKLAPELVQYQATPKDGNQCSGCVNWQAPHGAPLFLERLHQRVGVSLTPLKRTSNIN